LNLFLEPPLHINGVVGGVSLIEVDQSKDGMLVTIDVDGAPLALDAAIAVLDELLVEDFGETLVSSPGSEFPTRSGASGTKQWRSWTSSPSYRKPGTCRPMILRKFV
jgi:hypothetical protein